MKRIKTISHAIFVMFILSLSATCGQEDLDILTPMEKVELEALYSTIESFLGDSWNSSDLYPDPCGWTPIQGVSCDLFDGFWYVTTLNIGPVHDNSLSCAQDLEFRPHLFKLKHLKSLSFFNCFPSQDMFPGLIGNIPLCFGVLKNLQSLVILKNSVTAEIPSSIGNVIKLKKLVLVGNYLTSRIPDVFDRLNELLIFDLCSNSLSGSLPLTLGSLTSALKLDVNNNHLMDLMNNRFLGLSRNNLTGNLSLKLETLPYLNALYLSGNNLIRQSLASLKTFLEKWEGVLGIGTTQNFANKLD
ncbi:Piriformospora indica-insensitive protein 2 [Glycine max]|nr:Piriformospora indica-insensitive protein 2 [Glycine max]